MLIFADLTLTLCLTIWFQQTFQFSGFSRLGFGEEYDWPGNTSKGKVKGRWAQPRQGAAVDSVSQVCSGGAGTSSGLSTAPIAQFCVCLVG